MSLPEGVEKAVIRARGKTYTYYYWNPGRGTDREGERIKLPNADTHPADFWREVTRRQTAEVTVFPRGSVGELITRYRNSEEFKSLADGSQKNYEVHMRRFSAADTWGLLPVNDVTPLAAQTARDAMKDTPVMANQMLAVGRTIWDWGIPLAFAKINPFDRIKDLDVLDRGHVPWPSWVIEFVCAHTWPDLARMTRLGVMTCQRGSDLINMGNERRDRNGIWCRPKKTRKRRRSFLIPLLTADALELDRWAETPMTFSNARWLKPIQRFREDLYLYSPRGDRYTADSLRARWGRWLDGTKEGREICRKWKEWITSQVAKYEWDIDPEDADHPTIHGLRGTGILARAEQGYDVDQIANDIGMSRQNVEHYMRFRDQMKVASDGQRRLKIVGSDD